MRLGEVDLHVGTFCRAACGYCYIGRNHNCNNVFDHVASLAPTEVLKKVIANIHNAAKPDVLVFVGGDPCEHPNLLQLLKFTKELGDMDIAVLSNTHVYRNFGKVVSIEEIVPYVSELDFTLHGIGDKHEFINNDPGSYERGISQLKAFMRARHDDQGVAIVLNFIPYTLVNLKELLWDTADRIAMKPGLDYFMIQRIAPTGEAAIDYDQWKVINLNGALSIIEDFSGKTGIEVKLDTVDAFPWCAVDEKYWYMLHEGGCKWGQPDGILSVLPDGGIQRCALSSRVLGNFCDIDTPEKFTEFMAENQTLKAFMSCAHLDEKCKNCSLLKKCRGGCVIASGGDPYATDNITVGHDYLAK